jgi:hypothetical protein
MVPKELQREAIDAWREYGEALRKSFNMRQGYGLELLLVQEAFATDDPKYVEAFIQYVKEQTAAVAKLKFVGEK